MTVNGNMTTSQIFWSINAAFGTPPQIGAFVIANDYEFILTPNLTCTYDWWPTFPACSSYPELFGTYFFDRTLSTTYQNYTAC